MKFLLKWIDTIIMTFLFIGLVMAMVTDEWLSFIAIILFLSYIQLTKISYDLESLRDFQANVIKSLINYRNRKDDKNND